jgi:hypothetical protein
MPFGSMCYFEGVGVINYLTAETDRVEKLGPRLHMVPNSNSLMVIFPFKKITTQFE